MKKYNLFLIIGILVFGNLRGMYSGTRVQLKEEFKRAHQLKVGDEVLSFYTKKNKSDYSKIKKIREEVSDQVIIIETNNGKIFTNPKLRFYDPEFGKFIAAHDLRIGNKLMGLNFEVYRILKIKIVNRRLKTYFISIEKPYVYFIYDSKKCSILVHNENQAIDLKVLPLGLGPGFGMAGNGATNITYNISSAGGAVKIGGAGAAETAGAATGLSVGAIVGIVVVVVIVVAGVTYLIYRHKNSSKEPMVSYYKVFDVPRKVTKLEIEHKYRSLIFEPFLDSKLRLIFIEAYRCLSNSQSRKKYDKCFKKKKFDDFHNLLNKETMKQIESFFVERSKLA